MSLRSPGKVVSIFITILIVVVLASAGGFMVGADYGDVLADNDNAKESNSDGNASGSSDEWNDSEATASRSDGSSANSFETTANGSTPEYESPIDDDGNQTEDDDWMLPSPGDSDVWIVDGPETVKSAETATYTIRIRAFGGNQSFEPESGTIEMIVGHDPQTVDSADYTTAIREGYEMPVATVTLSFETAQTDNRETFPVRFQSDDHGVGQTTLTVAPRGDNGSDDEIDQERAAAMIEAYYSARSDAFANESGHVATEQNTTAYYQQWLDRFESIAHAEQAGTEDGLNAAHDVPYSADAQE